MGLVNYNFSDPFLCIIFSIQVNDYVKFVIYKDFSPSPYLCLLTLR